MNEDNKKRLEELRAKHRPKVLTEYERYQEERLAKFPLEEALKPYLESYKNYDKRQLMNLGGHACGCVGPLDNEPLCPCAMIGKAQEILLDQWYKNNLTKE